MELHSLNYLHYGAPKVWYCVPPAHKEKMDSFIAKVLYAQLGSCKDYMRHKVMYMASDPALHTLHWKTCPGRLLSKQVFFLYLFQEGKYNLKSDGLWHKQ